MNHAKQQYKQTTDTSKGWMVIVIIEPAVWDMLYCCVAVQNIVRRMSLRIDRVFPQHFRHYTLVAANSEGIATRSFQLSPGKHYIRIRPSWQCDKVQVFLYYIYCFLFFSTNFIVSGSGLSV